MAQRESAPAPLDDNTKKFLDFLGKAEGADYNTIVGGSKFEDFNAHPNVVGLRTKEGPSTAAGKYQITNTTYKDVASKLGINDFSPESQDKIALALIKRNGALEDVQKGDYNAAIGKLGKTWASLPSSPYSQPKRSQGFVEKALDLVVSPANANNMAKENGWESASTAPVSADAGWESAKAQGDGWESAKAQKPKKEKVPEKSLLTKIDDIVRGAADTLSFGYADEIAAKLDQLTGLNTANNTKQVTAPGQDPQSYDAILAAQRQRDKEGGGYRTIGQVGGALIPFGAVTTSTAGASRAARAGAGALTGAVQGGLYGTGSSEGDLEQRLADGVKGAVLGGTTGGILGGVLPATAAQKGNEFVRKAGSEAEASVNAEIIKRAQAEFNNPARLVNGKLPPLGAKELNQKITNSFLREGKDIVSQLPKNDPNKKELTKALSRGINNTQDELAALSKIKGGQEVVDIINKAQRADKLTAAMPANNNLLVKGARVISDFALPGVVSKPINYILNNRKSREDVGQRLIDKNATIADDILARFGPSKATESLNTLQGMATKAQQADVARRAAAAQANQAKMTESILNRNKGLEVSRMPLGGGFQELLQGGRSGLNMGSDEAIKALRVVSKMAKDSPVSDAAKTILKSGSVKNADDFYNVQNTIRRLSEEGKLPGVNLTQSGALSSSIRNPISYAANVKTAEEASKLARDSAPTKVLSQFANTVAGTKDPANKVKIIEERLAKTTDQAEIDYLNNFVRPLTKFGKK
jgi:hypothetical protein